MTDLTAITTPYGLLDETTKKALREHGGPYQCYTLNGVWQDLTWGFNWMTFHVYRVKPEPPKPREWWINMYEDECSYRYLTRHDADASASPNRIECVHVREVLE